MVAYCTADQVARYLRLTFDEGQKTAITTELIPAAENFIECICHRSFEPPQADETVKVDGADGYAVLPKVPVISLTSVKVDGIAVTDYDLSPEAGILYSDAITRGIRNVVVTGRFGFEQVPPAISHACVRLVAEYLKPYITEGFGVSMSWEQDSRVEFEAVAENNPDILKTLKRWRKW